MATTSITITHEAYNFLKNLKGNKSFSETILDFKSNSKNIIKFAGMLKNADTKSIEDVRKEINKDWNNRS
jgi:predicted CopG family antitoxin